MTINLGSHEELNEKGELGVSGNLEYFRNELKPIEVRKKTAFQRLKDKILKPSKKDFDSSVYLKR